MPRHENPFFAPPAILHFGPDTVVASFDRRIGEDDFALEDFYDLARQMYPHEDSATVDFGRVVVGGRGVSGPTRVDNAEYRQWVWEAFAADALDMESAAVAHVAYTNGVPFIAFRSLSDLAGAAPREERFRRFRGLVIGNATAVVLDFLEAAPTQE